MRVLFLFGVLAIAFASEALECGENAYFEECGRKRNLCPVTCENYQYLRKFCTQKCDIGCQCVEGFVKTADGQCVKPEQCPSKCGENAHFEECGRKRYHCPATCENYRNPLKLCKLECEAGCQCDEGYVKTAGGQCVRPEQCPSRGVDQEIEACDLPAETGVCRGFFPRYYFDRTTSTCQKFVYGGCGGNENNFQTIEECQNTCGKLAPSACLQEKVEGPCRAYFPRFYYNKDSGECEKFTYGGCQGNSNNFMDQEDCEAVCKT